MALHNQLGRQGEELAARFLADAGYTLLHRNWRHGRSEVDLIALKDDRLHFVEVKTRASAAFGPPEQSVCKKKMASLLRAASAFLQQHPQYTDFRIDVLSINLSPKSPPLFFLIEDVYV